VRLDHARAGFACLAHPTVDVRESNIQILWENATLALFRSARDRAVSVARRLARMVGVELRRKVRPAPRSPLESVAVRSGKDPVA
jgi:hypothetical protein